MTKPKKMFSFTDLSLTDYGDVKPIDGMAAGAFTDMWGREVEFGELDLPLYVANTKRALESTRDSSGEVVGFPIDQMNHYPGLAAGWITDVNLALGRAIIEFSVRWNDWAREKISANELRFFSPSIDLEAKTIVGGSLTNWPATRTDDNQILLRPVELSEAIMAYYPPEITGLFADLKTWITGMFARSKPGAPVEEAPEPVTQGAVPMPDVTIPTPAPVVEMSQEQAAQLERLVSERANLRFQEMVEREQRKNQILEFTRAVTGKGLPVQSDDLSAFLSTLTPDQLEKAEGLFTKIADTGVIDYTEKGHNKTLAGVQELPAEMKVLLSDWLAHDQTITEFFRLNAVELGNMADYNLSEFEKGK